MEGGGSWCDSDFLLFLPGEGDFFLLLRAFSFAAFACGLHGAGRHMLDGDGFERDGMMKEPTWGVKAAYGRVIPHLGSFCSLYRHFS